MIPVSRRSFLIASASAFLAPSSPNEGDPAIVRRAKGDAPALRMAVKIGMVHEGETLKDKFQLLKDLGYDGVEVDSPNTFRTQDVIAAKQSCGIAIHGVVDAIHWNKPLSHPDEMVREEGLAGLLTALRDAKAYGADSVLLVPAVVNKDVSYTDAYRRSQAMIRKALPLAETLGVTIGIENVWNNFLLSPIEMARYIDELESPRVAAIFDVGNVVRYGWPGHWVEALGRRLMKLDVKGYSRRLQHERGPSAGFEVELDEGDCDWPQVASALGKLGYNGWATAEVRGGDRARLADILARMNRALRPS